MGWKERITGMFYNAIYDAVEEAMRSHREGIATRRDYREGLQPRQLKVKPNQFDDNLTVNYTGLVVDRAVSMLLGEGVKFDLPGEGETPESQYLDLVWKANKQQILLQGAATLAAESGTGYVKIIPGGLPYDDGGKVVMLPRLVVLDPMWLSITTNPEDIGQVTAYTIRYNVTGPDGKDLAKKQEILYEAGEVDDNGVPLGEAYWRIENWEAPQGKWILVSEQRWEYEFPPVIHWQNLPDAVNVYGDPDEDDNVLALQNRINFVASNMSKIIRMYAHPRLWGKMLGEQPSVKMGPDEMLSYNNEKAELNQLEQLGDLTAISNYLQFLRQSMFDISQTVDFSSMSDKVGALTNFGLRVLTHDALARLNVKRAVFGEMLKELNRRLLVLSGAQQTDPGEVVWPDPLPVNEAEEMQHYEAAQRLGVMSKQTIAEKLGLDWETEQERLEADQSQEEEVGERLLRDFVGGGGNAPRRGRDRELNA